MPPDEADTQPVEADFEAECEEPTPEELGEEPEPEEASREDTPVEAENTSPPHSQVPAEVPAEDSQAPVPTALFEDSQVPFEDEVAVEDSQALFEEMPEEVPQLQMLDALQNQEVGEEEEPTKDEILEVQETAVEADETELPKKTEPPAKKAKKENRFPQEKPQQEMTKEEPKESKAIEEAEKDDRKKLAKMQEEELQTDDEMEATCKGTFKELLYFHGFRIKKVKESEIGSVFV